MTLPAGLDLTSTEKALIMRLRSAQGEWVASWALAERLKGLNWVRRHKLGLEGSTALRVHIYNIRRKLGSDFIESHKSWGYRLADGATVLGAAELREARRLLEIETRLAEIEPERTALMLERREIKVRVAQRVSKRLQAAARKETA